MDALLPVYSQCKCLAYSIIRATDEIKRIDNGNKIRTMLNNFY